MSETTAGPSAEPHTRSGQPELLTPEGGAPDPIAHYREVATTWLGALAPALLVIGNVLLPTLPRESVAGVAAFAGVADRYLSADLIYIAASLMFVPFTLALWRIRTARGASLRLIGGSLTIVGMLSNALSLCTWAYLLWGSAEAGVTQASTVALSRTLDGSAAALPISFIATPVAVLGMLLLLAGVLRSRTVPAWAPWCAIIGTVLLAAAGGGPPALVGILLAVGGAATVIFTRRS